MVAPIERSENLPVDMAHPALSHVNQPIATDPPGLVAIPQAIPGGGKPDDMQDWRNMLNAAMANPGTALRGKSTSDSRVWNANFCGFCWPIPTSLLACCCPCITFGKTYHSHRNDGNMEGYETINTSCLLFFATSCFCLHWLPEALLRSEIRKKYNLKGSCKGDLVRSFCCTWCEVVQSNKETMFREKESLVTKCGDAEQYSNGQQQMAYEQKPEA